MKRRYCLLMPTTKRALPSLASMLVLLAMASSLAACEDPKKFDVEYGVKYARIQLAKAEGRDPMATMSLQSLLEMGGTPIDYLMAGLSEKSTFTSYEWAKPTHPWTVVVREEPDAWVIEGYGEDLDKPFKTERVKFAPPPPPP